jgi:hypothetical protein
MRAPIALIILASLLVPAGCGGGPPVVTSGVDQSIAISDMNEGEAIALCEASMEASQLSAEMAAEAIGPCMTVGIMVLAFGGDAASCQSAVDECEAAGSGDMDMGLAPDSTDEATEEVTCDGSFGDTIGSECTATVGDYEACGNAALAQQHELSESLGCDMDISTGGSDTNEESLTPAECVALEWMGCTLGANESDSDDF